VFRSVLALFIRQGHDDGARARESVEAPGCDHSDGAAAFVRQIRSLRTTDTLDFAPLLAQLHVPLA